MNTHTNTPDFIPYVGEFEFAEDSQWGHVVLQLASRAGASTVYTDPEAELDDDGKWPRGSRVFITGRMYTDVQLGKLDGPGRYIRRDDPLIPQALGSRAALTKRQRRRLRKLRRAAKRQGEDFDETVTIAVITA